MPPRFKKGFHESVYVYNITTEHVKLTHNKDIETTDGIVGEIISEDIHDLGVANWEGVSGIGIVGCQRNKARVIGSRGNGPGDHGSGHSEWHREGNVIRTVLDHGIGIVCGMEWSIKYGFDFMMIPNCLVSPIVWAC